MKKYIHISVISIFILMAFGCAAVVDNYGSLRSIPDTGKQVTIQYLIDHWKDYNVYYAGYGVRMPLGVWFNPKNGDTRLVGDYWKPVQTQKDLIDITQWIYVTTQYRPYLTEIVGPHGRFYGYLYYSYGSVVAKKIGKNTMYVLNLEWPHWGGGLGEDID
ncbi:MAG: hypothetical protein P8012_18125 [Desulfobacterales bacterium]